MGSKNSKFLFLIIISSCFFFSKINAQDSLYLIGTITGESTDKRITNVKGIGDINGDGYDDFMISMRTGKKVRDEGIVKLYLGSADGNLMPDITFHYPGKDSLNDFGQNYSGIGDINNDGYNDFAIAGIFGDLGGYPKGKVFIYLGGETIDTIPTAEFNEPWIQDYLGQVVEGVGDINKDGYDDFIITSPYNWTDGKGRAYLFYGEAAFTGDKGITFISDTSTDFFGTSAANIGDLNKDGFDDIAIGAPFYLSGHDTGKVYIYYGGNPTDTVSDTILISRNAGDEFGNIIKNAGDLNKDKVIDYCIKSSDSIFIFISKDNYLKIEGYSLGAGGDINGDGYSDLIVGNNLKINVYFGSDNLDVSKPDIIIKDSISFSAAYVCIIGDLNKDGYDEIISFAVNWPNTENPQGKIYIYSYKKITDIKVNRKNIPDKFKLYQNYPNPFNPSTVIRWELATVSLVKISIYDVLGREIEIVLNEEQSTGEHEIEFDASKYNLSSGIYFCELKIIGGNTSINGVESQRLKMVLIK